MITLYFVNSERRLKMKKNDKIYLRINSDLKKQLQQTATDLGLNLSSFITMIIHNYKNK